MVYGTEGGALTVASGREALASALVARKANDATTQLTAVACRSGLAGAVVAQTLGAFVHADGTRIKFAQTFYLQLVRSRACGGR